MQSVRYLIPSRYITHSTGILHEMNIPDVYTMLTFYESLAFLSVISYNIIW